MVHALIADPAVRVAIAAAFEEEGVPATIADAPGDALALARRAAAEAPGLVGIGADHATIVVVLAAAPGAAYIAGPVTDARRVARSAARIVARRPLVDAPRATVDTA